MIGRIAHKPTQTEPRTAETMDYIHRVKHRTRRRLTAQVKIRCNEELDGRPIRCLIDGQGEPGVRAVEAVLPDQFTAVADVRHPGDPVRVAIRSLSYHRPRCTDSTKRAVD